MPHANDRIPHAHDRVLHVMREYCMPMTKNCTLMRECRMPMTEYTFTEASEDPQATYALLSLTATVVTMPPRAPTARTSSVPV